MDVLTVALGERSYDIVIGTGFDGLAAKLSAVTPSKQFMVVTNDVVAPLYLESLANNLPGASI